MYYINETKTQYTYNNMLLRNGKNKENANLPASSYGKTEGNNIVLHVEEEYEKKRLTKEECINKIKELLVLNQTQSRRKYKIERAEEIFELINDYGDYFKKMSKLLVVIYKKTLLMTCELIKDSYSYAIKKTNQEKSASIKLLHTMYLTRKKVSPYLLDISREPATKDKLSILALKVDENNLTSDDEQEIDLYRCLCHMKSNYNEPYEYNIETYEDSEYTNVELYNWYLEVNNIYDIKSDRYVNGIEACIETEIIHMNPLIWD